MKRNIVLLLILFVLGTELRAQEEVRCYGIDEMVDMLEKGEDVCGKKMCIFDLNFDFGKWDLKDQSRDILESVVYLLDGYPEMRLRVVGHTDSIGTHQSNEILSRNRAREVAHYLQTRGIEGDSIAYDGKGEMEPIDDNGTKVGRARNRRVELEVRYKCKDQIDAEIRDTSDRIEDDFIVPSDILPKEYRKDLEEKMVLCGGDNPPNILGRWKISDLMYRAIGDEEWRGSEDEKELWFLESNYGRDVTYYEREYGRMNMIVDDIEIVGEGECFTVYFVAKIERGQSWCKKVYVISGKKKDKWIEGIDVYTVVVDKFDIYDEFDRVGRKELYTDGDGVIEPIEWKIGQPMEQGERPKRKNKKWCPGCP